jgi:hypothetical protein
LIAQLEPGNTSTEITLPGTMELYNLGYSPESITDALYKAALIVKEDRRCGYKKNKLKLKHRQQHLQKQRLEQLKRKLRMRKDLLQKRERKQLQQKQQTEGKQGSTQPQKIDLKERMTIL